MKRSLIFFFSLVIAAGCQNKNSFTVKGTLKEPGNNKTIFLKRVAVNTLLPLDSSEITGKRGFKFTIKATEPDFYQLGYSESDFITLLAEPGEKIELSLNGKSLSASYEVKGSDGTEKVRMLDMRLNDTKRKLDSLRIVYNTASGEKDSDQKKEILENEFNNLLKDLRKKNIEFIISNTKSMASIKALYQRIDENTYVLYDPRDLQYLKIIADTLGRYYPDSRNVKALVEDVKKELTQMNALQLQNMASSSPEVKLDPDLKDINGKRTSLSSLRGKVVLLSFWSVDSKECIAENLQLKNIYKAYSKKGFEIYQINIDKNEEKWRAEVKFDELPWINAREEDPDNPQNAILFNVRSLPANYLFDRDGTLIALNLHGRALQIKMNQLFNN